MDIFQQGCFVTESVGWKHLWLGRHRATPDKDCNELPQLHTIDF